MKTLENEVNYFTVPTRNEVSSNNQVIFDNLEKSLGFVPNLYATFALNETALGDYLTLQNRKSTLSPKEREIINLVVSQVNDCKYCLAAHTILGKVNGFTDDQILEIRRAQISFNEKWAVLSKFVRETTINRGRPSENSVKALFDAGYTKANSIDIIMIIGDKIISNYLHSFTQIPVDFPIAPNL